MTERLFDDGEDMQILLDALSEWGYDAQTNMAIEEMCELMVELMRHHRGRSRTEDVVEEIADARIMLEQMALLHGRDATERAIEEKLRDLEERLEEGP